MADYRTILKNAGIELYRFAFVDQNRLINAVAEAHKQGFHAGATYAFENPIYDDAH